MDAIRTRGERRLPEWDVVMLADGEDRTTGRMGGGDRRETIVGTRRQVDDDPIDVRQGRLEGCGGANGSRLGARTAHEIGESRCPDQVVGKDGDARGQARPSAR